MDFADDPRAKGRHPSGAAICQKCGASGALVATLTANWLFKRQRAEVLCEPCFYMVYATCERFGVNIAVRSL